MILTDNSLNFVDLTRACVIALKQKEVPFIIGEPGIGKSALINNIAEMLDLCFIDLRLSEIEPQDINGIPFINTKINKASYLPMDIFPLEGEELPVKSNGQRYKGYLIGLEEFNHATPELEKACFKLINDKKIGKYNLHENCYMIAAGNREVDTDLVKALSTPMQSRLIHLSLHVNADNWFEWAVTKGDIDHRVVSFIKYRPNNLHSYDPDHDDCTYACPRTLHKVSKLIKGVDRLTSTHKALILGTVGRIVGSEFIAYSRIYKDLIKVEDILKDPENAYVPREPGELFALSGSMGNYSNAENIPKLITYLKRFPSLDFEYLAAKAIYKSNPNIADKSPEFNKWVFTFSEMM